MESFLAQLEDCSEDGTQHFLLLLNVRKWELIIGYDPCHDCSGFRSRAFAACLPLLPPVKLPFSKRRQCQKRSLKESSPISISVHYNRSPKLTRVGILKTAKRLNYTGNLSYLVLTRGLVVHLLH